MKNKEYGSYNLKDGPALWVAEWGPQGYKLWVDETLVEEKSNLYGFVPFVEVPSGIEVPIKGGNLK